LASTSIREPSQALQRLDLSGDGAKLQNGLAKLVLTIAQLLKEVLERQALRRVESGSLTEEEVERLGLAFMAIDRKLQEMSQEFGMKPGELRKELATLFSGAGIGASSTDIVELIDRLLDKGVAVAGQVKIAVADINLVGLDLLAVLYPIYKEEGGPTRP
jgi:Gas vesicle protein K/Gas vesicle protein